MRKLSGILLVTLMLGMMVVGAWGAVPAKISFHGRISDSSGPINGSATLTFKIQEGTDRGSKVAWDKTINVSNITDGIFTVVLEGAGQTNRDITLADVPFNKPYYLHIYKGSSYLGMQPINAVPYALYAEKSGGGTWEKNNNDISYNLGNVGIGTFRPEHALHVYGTGGTSVLIDNDSGAYGIKSTANFIGVHGNSTDWTGVWGTGKSFGLSGISILGIGAYGGGGLIGVSGGSLAGTGTLGTSITGTGVFGFSQAGYAGAFWSGYNVTGYDVSDPTHTFKLENLGQEVVDRKGCIAAVMDSKVDAPHLLLYEDDLGINVPTDYARITFTNSTSIRGSNDPKDPKYYQMTDNLWTIGAMPQQASFKDQAKLNFYYRTGGSGSNLLTITGDGRVGVNNSSPLGKLHVHGGPLYLSGSSSNIMWPLAQHFQIGQSDDGISFTERIRITKTGNVGIGVTAPNAKLEVADEIRVRPDISDQAAAGQIKSYRRGGSKDAADLRLGSSDNPETVIINNNKVGIKDDTPDYTLDVNGSFYASSARIGSNGPSIMTWKKSSTFNTASNWTNYFTDDAEWLVNKTILHASAVATEQRYSTYTRKYTNYKIVSNSFKISSSLFEIHFPEEIDKGAPFDIFIIYAD